MITRRHLVMAGAALPAGQVLGSSGIDWSVAAPETQDMRAAAVADTLEAGEALPGLRAVVVARRGLLVAERYYGGVSAQDLQPINSATKSVCSMLVGLALRDGRLQGAPGPTTTSSAPQGGLSTVAEPHPLRSLGATVAQLIPDAVAEVPGSPAGPVTLHQILAGRSGLAFDWSGFAQLAGAKPLTRHVLGLPAVAVPPPGWSYNDAMVSLLAPILERAQGADLAALAARQLFDPMGIEHFSWRRDRDGRPLAPAGLALRPRDLLKLASLMLDGGLWRGTQVLPESWVAESLSPVGPATWRAGPVEDVGYGLLWFTGRLHGQRVAWAWGYGGQFALLAPELKLAVATAATSPPPSALKAQTDAVMTLVGRMVQAVA